MTEVYLCRVGEIPDGSPLIVPIGGDREVGVYFHSGKHHAYLNRCHHQGGPVCEGLLVPKVRDVLNEDRTWAGQTFDESEMHIVCPWHAYEFKLDDGECATMPGLKLRKFPIVEREGALYAVV